MFNVSHVDLARFFINPSLCLKFGIFLNTSLTENVNDSFIEHVIFHWRKAKILVSKVDEAKNLKMVPLNRIRESDTLSIGLILSYSGTSVLMAT